MIGGDDPSQVLGIELNGQGRRAHKVAQQHRELTTLGAVMHGFDSGRSLTKTNCSRIALRMRRR
jgi:hypothetical protein